MGGGPLAKGLERKWKALALKRSLVEGLEHFSFTSGTVSGCHERSQKVRCSNDLVVFAKC